MAAAAARQSVEGGLPLFPRCFVDPWSSFAAMEPTVRLNVTLDAEHAAKLERLARRTHTQEGTLAGSLLSHAIDEAAPDARHVADLLDRIPGTFERAERGRADAEAGQTIPLDEL